MGPSPPARWRQLKGKLPIRRRFITPPDRPSFLPSVARALNPFQVPGVEPWLPRARAGHQRVGVGLGWVGANPLKPSRGPHAALISPRCCFWAGKGKHKEERLSPVAFVFGSH